MEEQRFVEYQIEMEKWYESICRRCGKCCGVGDGDPCGRLVKMFDGTYQCSKYEGRLGPQVTVSGKTFNCVMIREVLKHRETIPDCAYRKP